MKSSQQKILLSEADIIARGHRHSRMHRRRLIDEGRFPAPVRLSENTNAWFLDEIEVLEQRLREERDAEVAARRAEAEAATASGEPPVKRKPGRPPRKPVPALFVAPQASPEPAPVKRGRGRPRKNPPPAGPSSGTSDDSAPVPIAAAPRR